jgi:GH18 family chitinase
MGEHCFDGIDIDYENFVTDGIDRNLTQFLKELSPYLKAYGYGSSIDVPASQWGGRHFSHEVPNYVDQVNIMAYDFTGPWSEPGPHSSFEMSIGSGANEFSTGLAYWQNFRRWPKEKLLLGLPFYGRDFDNQNGAGITFSEILEIDPNAGSKNQVNNIYYNGFDVIKSKVAHVRDNGYPGVFIWELAQDSNDPSQSLLIRASETLNQ